MTQNSILINFGMNFIIDIVNLDLFENLEFKNTDVVLTPLNYIAMKSRGTIAISVPCARKNSIMKRWISCKNSLVLLAPFLLIWVLLSSMNRYFGLWILRKNTGLLWKYLSKYWTSMKFFCQNTRLLRNFGRSPVFWQKIS